MRKRFEVEPPVGTKIARTSMKMTCRRCGGIDYNKRTCIASLPTDASFQLGSQVDIQ